MPRLSSSFYLFVHRRLQRSFANIHNRQPLPKTSAVLAAQISYLLLVNKIDHRLLHVCNNVYTKHVITTQDGLLRDKDVKIVGTIQMWAWFASSHVARPIFEFCCFLRSPSRKTIQISSSGVLGMIDRWLTYHIVLTGRTLWKKDILIEEPYRFKIFKKV